MVTVEGWGQLMCCNATDALRPLCSRHTEHLLWLHVQESPRELNSYSSRRLSLSSCTLWISSLVETPKWCLCRAVHLDQCVMGKPNFLTYHSLLQKPPLSVVCHLRYSVYAVICVCKVLWQPMYVYLAELKMKLDDVVYTANIAISLIVSCDNVTMKQVSCSVFKIHFMVFWIVTLCSFERGHQPSWGWRQHGPLKHW